LASKHVCACTNGCTLQQAAAGERRSTGTNDTAAKGLFAKVIAACGKACTGCEGEDDVLNGHGGRPFDLLNATF
jgi:hypothetical protein